MKPRSLVFTLFLLACVSSAWAQNRSGSEDAVPMRPLNLSLPRDALRSSPPTFQAAPEDTATRNLRHEVRERERQEERERLPYGTGYEARQQGMPPSPVFGGGTGGGAAGPAGMGGGGPGGHGGRMGRGR